MGVKAMAIRGSVAVCIRKETGPLRELNGSHCPQPNFSAKITAILVFFKD